MPSRLSTLKSEMGVKYADLFSYLELDNIGIEQVEALEAAFNPHPPSALSLQERETIRRRSLHHETTFDPTVKRSGINPGFLSSYLVLFDSMLNGRWHYLVQSMKHELKTGQPYPKAIPAIRFVEPRNEVMEQLRRIIAIIQDEEPGTSQVEAVEYFVDHLLYALGAQHGNEFDDSFSKKFSICYQAFNIATLLAYPSDYIGQLIAEVFEVTEHMPSMASATETADRLFKYKNKTDQRRRVFIEYQPGSGRNYLAASNYVMHFAAIEEIVDFAFQSKLMTLMQKAFVINAYLYAPWLIINTALPGKNSEAEYIPEQEEIIRSAVGNTLSPRGYPTKAFIPVFMVSTGRAFGIEL